MKNWYEIRQEDLCLRCVVTGEIAENCYILFREGRPDCVVVDPGDDAALIQDATEKRAISAILLTHGHFDHIGAVDALMTAETRLLVHSADVGMLTDPYRNASWLMNQRTTVSARAETFEDQATLELAGITFTVLHTPGHSPGSCCFRVGDWLLTGDTVMSGGMGIGRTDLPGGDEAQLHQSLRMLIPILRGNYAFGGHGSNDHAKIQI